jgi:hypothetical protein
VSRDSSEERACIGPRVSMCVRGPAFVCLSVCLFASPPSLQVPTGKQGEKNPKTPKTSGPRMVLKESPMFQVLVSYAGGILHIVLLARLFQVLGFYAGVVRGRDRRPTR